MLASSLIHPSSHVRSWVRNEAVRYVVRALSAQLRLALLTSHDCDVVSGELETPAASQCVHAAFGMVVHLS